MKKILILLTALLGQASIAGDWFLRDDTLYDEAYVALESTASVRVDSDWNLFRFAPTETIRSTCFILYPGAFINPRAYAPIAHHMAEAGFLSYVIRFPLRFGLLRPDAALDAKQDRLAKRHCDTFVMSGHSLGGVVAARHANEALDAALILLASYTEDNVYIDHSIKTISIWATEDGFTDYSDIEGSFDNLPPDTNFIKIDGGNHAHFGWVRPRRGDGVASITVEEQQAIIYAKILEVLESLDAQN